MASEHASFFSPRQPAGDRGALLLWQRGGSDRDDRIAFLDGWSGAAPEALPPAPVVRWGARLDQPLTDAMAASDGLGLAYPAPLSFLADDGTALFRPLRRTWTQKGPEAGTFLREDGRLEVGTDVRAFPRSAAFRLQSTARVLAAPAISLHRFSAAHAPLPPWATEVTAFAGDWSGEFRPTTVPLGPSGFSWQRSAGRSDHHRYPALLCSEGPLAADRGRVLAVILAASGDHELRIDQRVDGTFMVQGGAYLNPGDGCLSVGDTLTTPALWFVFSEHGTNGLRQQIHALQRSEAFPQEGLAWPRPVHLNSWEGLYFGVSEQALLELVASAKALGVERFVVDDGWFQDRIDDRRALGDWLEDRRRLPRGLGPIAEAVEAAGMSLGLWVEPEMVSANSALARAHPEWLRGGDGGLESRHQRVLDLGQEAVQEAVFSFLEALLTRLPITYLKWDHNRILTGQWAGPGVGHGAQVAGLYAVLRRLRAAFPRVELETCASGGGRMDWGMLDLMHRAWLSDANDPIVRTPIMMRGGLFLAPERAGVHVGPSPAHGTGRVTSMAFRCTVGLLGHFGLELDPRGLSAEDWRTLKAGIERYKRLRPLLHSGLVFDYEVDEDHWVRVVVSEDRREALAIVLRLGDQGPGRPLRVPLPGLAADLSYAVRLEAPAAGPVPGLGRFEGAGLAVAPGYLPAQGLPLQLPQPQSALVLRFTAQPFLDATPKP